MVALLSLIPTNAWAQTQSTSGNCSPAVVGVGGNVSINCNFRDKIEQYARDLGMAHNGRYGFWVQYPKLWQGAELPSNSDGFTFTDPDNSLVSIAAYGSTGAQLDQPSQADLKDDAMNFYAPRLVKWFEELGDKVLDEKKAQIRIAWQTREGRLVEKDRVDARRFVIDSELDGKKIRVIRYVTNYKGSLYFEDFSAPRESFSQYQNLFLRLAYGFSIDPESLMSP